MEDMGNRKSGLGSVNRLFVGFIIISLIFSSITIGFADNSHDDIVPTNDIDDAIPTGNSNGMIKLKYGSFDPIGGNAPIIASANSYGNSPWVEQPYIIQAPGKITEEWKSGIIKAGATIVSYIPDNALLVTMNTNAKGKVNALQDIRWCGSYEPAYKVDPALATATGIVKLSITLFPGSSNGDIVREITKNSGGNILGIANSREVNTVNAEVDASLISYLISRPEVKWVSEFVLAEPSNDDNVPLVQSGSTTRPLHAQGINGRGEVVTIADSGIAEGIGLSDIDHDSFNGAVYGIPGNYLKVKANYVPEGADGQLGDESGSAFHGSFAAGVIAGDGAPYGIWNPGTYDGHAFMAEIVMQDIMREDDAATPDILEWQYVYPPEDYYNDLFKFTEDNYDSKIQSNSWGGGSGYRDQCVMIDSYVYDSQDFSMFWSVGGDGPSGYTIDCQAESKNVIGVGSASSDGITVSAFSSRGPAMDGRIKPDIVVPGESVQSVDGGGGYQTMQGTSWATAAAGGAAAMVRQYYREGWYPKGYPVNANGWSPSAALLKATMINGAVDIGTPDIPNMDEGWGRIHLDNSLYFIGDSKEMMVIDQSQGMVTGDYMEYEISVTDASEPLKISLVWSDYQGDPAAAKALVNDLDLTLIAPGAMEYKGNVFSGGESMFNGSYDILNNVECAYLNIPSPGIYTIRIDASNIAIGPQNFALVATGNFDDGHGLIQMDRSVYDDSDIINFRLEDTNSFPPTVDITITGSVSGDSEIVTLNVLDFNSSVYTGSILTDMGIAAPGDGKLQVSDGETITTTYSDTSPIHDSIAYALIDIHEPVISNVFASEISGVSTIMTWDTDENANSTVYYRVFGSPTWTIIHDDHLVMDHQIPMTGLLGDTKYEFWVESADMYGRSTYDDYGGGYYTFSTRSATTGGPLIMLVDDDIGSISPLDGSPYELDWMNNLEYTGWTYSHWDMNVLGSPSTEDLNQASMIIWVPSEGFPQLSADDREALAGYLDQPLTSQGTVPMAYIVGQDIAWDMSLVGTDPDVTWCEDYLKAEYLGDDADGGGGDEGGGGPPGTDPFMVIDNGHVLNDIYNLDNMDLEQDVYGSSRFWPDDINAIAPGVAIWDYNDHEYGGTAAGVAQTGGGAAGTARIAFNAFSHNMIDSTNTGGNWDPAGSPPTIDLERAELLDETIQWLLGGNHPTADLVNPIGGETITSTTTYTIDWTISDATSVDVYYSPNSGQEYIKINGAPLPGSQTSLVWDISALEDADTYRIKVVGLGTATYAVLSDYSESMDFTIEHGVDNTPPITVPGSVVSDINPIEPGDSVNLNAIIDDSMTGESYITAAEWCLGETANWPGTPMNVVDGVWDEINEDVTVFIPGAVTAGWSIGEWNKLWVRGQDSSGNWAGSYATAIYIAGFLPEIPYDMGMDVGWRFVSFPVNVDNSVDIIFNDTIFGDGGTTWSSIMWYDPADAIDHWKCYDKAQAAAGLPQDMPDVDNTMGVWMYVTRNDGDNLLTMGETGSAPSGTVVTLQPGWNMVGYPSDTEGYTAGNLKVESGGMVMTIERFNDMSTYGIEPMPDGAAFQIGQAYWIYSNGFYPWMIP